MKKILLLTVILQTFLFSNEIVFKKIKNLIGEKNYKTHQSLIQLLFKDDYKYIIGSNIKYVTLFKTLKANGLLELRYEKPANTTIEFIVNNKTKKAYKILHDTLQSLGYRYFLTKQLKKENKKQFFWKIEFRSEYMIDPLVLSKELQLKNCRITNVENQASNHWKYELDFQNARLNEAKKIEKNEKVKFQKPLQAYMINVDDAETLQIISRKLNNWHPYIVFFDDELNVIDSIKKNRIYKGYTSKVPKNTNYIKITDLYNLINIKRGLSIIVK